MKEPGLIRNQKVSSDKLKVSRRLRRDMTAAENEFWSIVRNRKLCGLKFRRQQVIDGFIVDFFCDEHGLIIEIDGGVHQNEEQYKYDKERDKVITLRNLRILRFSNDDVFNNKEMIVERIKGMI